MYTHSCIVVCLPLSHKLAHASSIMQHYWSHALTLFVTLITYLRLYFVHLYSWQMLLCPRCPANKLLSRFCYVRLKVSYFTVVLMKNRAIWPQRPLANKMTSMARVHGHVSFIYTTYACNSLAPSKMKGTKKFSLQHLSWCIVMSVYNTTAS